MNDEQQICNLVYRYAECVDAGDFDGVGRLFADATYRARRPDGKVATTTGADEVAALMASMVIRYPNGTPRTRHVTSNLIVELDGDAATCRSCYTVFQAVPGLPLQPIITGRYEDRFERTDGRWRFADRMILMDLAGDLSHHLRGNLVLDP
jgi:3-phenylpropionate/cinnamic acid dioxygenase small subunit